MRVAIVEDRILRELLAEAFAAQGLTVVGTAATLETGLDLVLTERPDVAVLDVRLPPTETDEGLVIAETVRAQAPDVGLLMFSAVADPALPERLLLLDEPARAVGYLLKERVGDLAQLVESMHRVAAGEAVVDPDILRPAVAHASPQPSVQDPVSALTPHEQRLLGLLAEGRSNRSIARSLGRPTGVVENQLSGIASRLGLVPATASRSDVNVRVLLVLAYLRHLRRVARGPGAPQAGGGGATAPPVNGRDRLPSGTEPAVRAATGDRRRRR